MLLGGGISNVLSTGSFGGGAGQLIFAGGVDKKYALGDGASFTGSVTVGIRYPNGGLLEGARIDIPAGTVVQASGENTFYGGSYLQGLGTFEVLGGGTLHWTSDPHGPSTMRDAGVTRIDAGATLRVDGPDAECPPDDCGGVNLGEAPLTDPNRQIQNYGTTVLENAGYIAADGGTIFLNCGTFRIENDKGIFEGRTTDQLKNVFDDCAKNGTKGSVEMNAAAVATIDARFSGDSSDHKPGKVSIAEAGTLRLFGKNITGSITTADTATLSSGTTFDPTCPPMEDCPQYTPLPHATFVKDIDGRVLRITLVEAQSDGYVLGYTTTIDAPNHVNGVSVSIILQIDSSLVGEAGKGAFVIKNYGVTVPACTVHGQVGPDPCVDRRKKNPTEGDVQIFILTDHLGASPDSGRCCKFGLNK
jgi:hypothetical protein